MSTDLIPFDTTQLPAPALPSQADVDTLAPKTSFPKSIWLFGKQKQVAKGLIPAGHFGIADKEVVTKDFGKRVDLYPLDMRSKACDFAAGIYTYTRDGAEFQDIQARFEEGEKGVNCGFEFLVVERTTGEVCTYYFGGLSSRGESQVVLPYLAARQPFSLTSKFVEGRKGSYYVPVTLECAVPFAIMPPPAALGQAIGRFRNPTDVTPVTDTRTQHTR